MKRQLEYEAIEVLRDTLSQISAIKIKKIEVESHGHRADNTIFAHVDIYGHAHLLVCKVAARCDLLHLQRTFIELRKLHARLPGDATPVLIAPILSAEAQRLCGETNTSFIDLEGNARIYLSEVFIVKRSLNHRKTLPSQAEPLPTSETARIAVVA